MCNGPALLSLPFLFLTMILQPSAGHNSLQADPSGSRGLTTGPSEQPWSKYLQLPGKQPHAVALRASTGTLPDPHPAQRKERVSRGLLLVAHSPRAVHHDAKQGTRASKSQAACGRPSRPEASSSPTRYRGTLLTSQLGKAWHSREALVSPRCISEK